MEQWKDIEGYDGVYQVSNLGKVRSLKFGKEKILVGNILTHGHTQVTFSMNGKCKLLYNHRLVGIYFIPNPLNLPLVCHKDETLGENGALYNGADNLFWGTVKDNAEDREKKGRGNNHFKNNHPSKGLLGKYNFNSKKVYQYSFDGKLIKEWGSIVDIKRDLGISNYSISNCCRGKQKTASGFIWKF